MTDELPDSIVFDAESLVAYFTDEAGSEVVESYLEAVEGGSDGYISAVNLAELHYVVRAIADEARADDAVRVVQVSSIRVVDATETWALAADFKHQYAPALGDAFALATAANVDGTLLVGADDDYDDVTDVPIVRFRSEAD